MTNKKIVFDVGFHNGNDTSFYLSNKFKVIAVEANPTLFREGLRKFKSKVKSGELILLNKAVSNKDGKTDFYIHRTKSDWSSCLLNMAESDGSKPDHIIVDSVTIKQLFNNYGVPYYMKVDIEGNDIIVAKHLFINKEKPKFVSFEISRKDYFEIFSYLYVSGYTKFQLINQINNLQLSSGKFGDMLPKEKWISYDELLTRYVKYKDLKILDNVELGIGWLDVHAMMES